MPDPLTGDPQRLEALLRYRMPFGKYEGVRLLELPQAYLVWFQKEGWPPGKLGELMQLALEVDHNGLKPMLAPLMKD